MATGSGKRRGFGKVYQDEITSVLPKLQGKSAALSVYVVLLACRNSKTDETIELGYALLEQITGLAKSSVQKGIKDLIELQIIARLSGGNGREKRSKYKFLKL